MDFTDEPWPKVSDSAKNLIRKLCERDVRKRLTAEVRLPRDRLVRCGWASSERGPYGSLSLPDSEEADHCAKMLMLMFSLPASVAGGPEASLDCQQHDLWVRAQGQTSYCEGGLRRHLCGFLHRDEPCIACTC